MNFSVLLSVYEKEKPEFLKGAIDSLLAQTLPGNEIIIIKDGVLPESLENVLQSYMEISEHIKTFQFRNNVMLGRALAKGVQLCSNELIARMDTDDIAEPDRFRLQYEYMMRHPDVSVVGGFIREFADNGEVVKLKAMPVSYKEIKEYAKYRNPLNHMTVMFRKQDVIECGNYEHFPFLEDYLLWSKMLARGKKICNIAEVLVAARTSQNLYQRRGGYEYFKQYCLLRKMQLNFGITNYREYIYSLICTFGITMVPISFRKFVYKVLLRRK